MTDLGESKAVPERWKGICALLQEKNWPVFHNSLDVETILAIAEELGTAEAKVSEQAQTIERLTKVADGNPRDCQRSS